jgi:hypothetical protein
LTLNSGVGQPKNVLTTRYFSSHKKNFDDQKLSFLVLFLNFPFLYFSFIYIFVAVTTLCWKVPIFSPYSKFSFILSFLQHFTTPCSKIPQQLLISLSLQTLLVYLFLWNFAGNGGRRMKDNHATVRILIEKSIC